MDRPRVSVVTPSYNQLSYIGDNLASVRNQRYSDVEHVVVDGESTDGTVEMLADWESTDNYDLRWTSEPDDGQSDAINKGFDRATGEIVGWLNSDDVYFDVDVLPRVVSYFERTDADIVYGDLAYLDADSTVLQVDIRPDFDRAALAYRSLVGQPATFFRSEVLADERLDPDFHFCMDWEFWLRLSADYEFRHVTDVLAGFRYHAEQKTEDRGAMEREYRRLRKKHGIESTRGIGAVLTRTVPAEVRRVLAAFRLTYKLHSEQPTLAFDGELAPLWQMLANVGPGRHDVQKTLNRWLDG